MPSNSYNPISPLGGGNINTYYPDREYPYDLNGALDFTRPATGQAVYGYPSTIGYIQGLVPLLDNREFSLMLGETPNGHTVDLLDNKELIDFAFPDISGGLTKVRG